MPRRDFGPLSTNHNNVSSNHNNLSTYHNNLSSYHNNNPNHIEEQGHTDAVKLQGKLPCGQHEGNILHHNQSAKEGCQRKVLPSPDGQRLWLVLGTPLLPVVHWWVLGRGAPNHHMGNETDSQSNQESCLRKVLPSPDGQRLWLVLGTPLPVVHWWVLGWGASQTNIW